jgi:hypothetical protein
VRRASVALALGALLVAGCGGSDFKDAATSATATTVESPETQAWVAAAARGVESSPDMKMSASVAECLARALVESVTVERLKSAGVTKEDLEDPNADLPARLGASLPSANKRQLGAALQACGSGIFGRQIAEGIAHEVGNGYTLDAAARKCVDQWFTSPDRQPLLASLVLNEGPTPTDAAQLADLVVTCLDVATLISPAMHTRFDANERDCINRMARASRELRTAMQAEIGGTRNSSTTHLEEIFGATIVKCLTPQHLLQLGKQNKSP